MFWLGKRWTWPPLERFCNAQTQPSWQDRRGKWRRRLANCWGEQLKGERMEGLSVWWRGGGGALPGDGQSKVVLSWDQRQGSVQVSAVSECECGAFFFQGGVTKQPFTSILQQRFPRWREFGQPELRKGSLPLDLYLYLPLFNILALYFVNHFNLPLFKLFFLTILCVHNHFSFCQNGIP